MACYRIVHDESGHQKVWWVEGEGAEDCFGPYFFHHTAQAAVRKLKEQDIEKTLLLLQLEEEARKRS